MTISARAAESPLFAANSAADDAPDISADRSEVREGLETEARGRKLLIECEELVADGALRVGSALAKIKEKVPLGLWLRELAALRINQSRAWYYMEFAKIKDDDRAAYLWLNGFSVRKAVDEYRIRTGVSRKKGPPTQEVVPQDSPASPRARDERLAEIARQVEFAIQMIDDREAELASDPDPEPALSEIADAARSVIRQHLEAELIKKIPPARAGSP